MLFYYNSVLPQGFSFITLEDIDHFPSPPTYKNKDLGRGFLQFLSSILHISTNLNCKDRVDKNNNFAYFCDLTKNIVNPSHPDVRKNKAYLDPFPLT